MAVLINDCSSANAVDAQRRHLVENLEATPDIVRITDTEGNVLNDDHGEVACFSTLTRDMRPYKQVEEQLQTLFSALAQTADMVWVTDSEGRLEYANRAFEAMTGYSWEEIRGCKVGNVLKSGMHDDAFYERLWSQLLAGQPFCDVFTNINREGEFIHLDETITPIEDDGGNITHFIATAREITERLSLEKRLRELAYYDPVTGLANRSHFEEQLAHSQQRADRTGELLALLMVDLDRFKAINDSLGHAAGDDLLIQLAQRLNNCLRASDLMARWGGDEFVILLDPVDGKKGAMQVAEKLGRAMGSSFTIRGTTLYIDMSIGISLSPDDASDPGSLLKQADIALFEAKRSAGSNYRFFSPRDSEAVTQRFEMERYLQQALAENACEPFFQAFIDLFTGDVVGAEALARCRLAGSMEWIPPDQFIPVAEHTGLIHQLGAQVLRKACRQFMQWRRTGYRLERLAVNVSPVQLADERFGQLVCSILEETGIDPGWLELELELTEEALLIEGTPALSTLEELDRKGVTVTLDDFGKGYSSPSHLYKLPVSRMKIDRSFVKAVDEDLRNQTIINGLVGLAKGFDCQITVEGVERCEEADYLRSLGIEEVQGFLFGRPMPADAFERVYLTISGESLSNYTD